MEESIRRFDLDEAFSFVFGNSVSEPVTPYRVAIYLLIRTLDCENRARPFSQKHLVELSSLVYTLLNAVNLSFVELCQKIERPLERISPGLHAKFLKRVDKHRDSAEILIRRDELMQLHQRRSDRTDRLHHFVTPKSVIGIFIRKLAVARARQSVTEIERSHKQWLQWLSDTRPSARFDLFGDYCTDWPLETSSSTFSNHPSSFAAANDVARLVPLVDDVHLSVAPIKDRTALLTERLLASSISFPKTSEKRQCAEKQRVRHVFKCDTVPPAVKGHYSLNSCKEDVGVQLPLAELLSSSRARALISRQIHALHVAPDEAMKREQLKAACAFIKANYPDLPMVHLVELMNAIRSRNVAEAENALREFFDWTTIKVNDGNAAGIGGTSITAVDRRPLRYAPLLHARLARIFGQREQALHLLSEAIQQAHSNRDLVCLRLALVEQAAIEALPVEDCEDSEPSVATSESLRCGAPEPNFSPALLLSMWTSEEPAEEETEGVICEEGELHRDIVDTRAFVRQLRDCATLQNCIDLALCCEKPQTLASGLQACIGADYGIDRESQTRLVNEAAKAIAASVKFANGFVSAATSDSHMLLHFNFGDQWCQRYDTEAQVIAAVNVVYSHALNGRYAAALALIDQIKKRFSIANNSVCASHYLRCESLVQFDRAFMFGEWSTAESWLSLMLNVAPEEADLRRCILEYSRGDLREAINIARSRVKKSKHSKDLRLKIRCEMVLAMLYASNRLGHVARASLEQCAELARSHNVENYEAAVLRRLAYIDAVEGRTEEALKKISKCEWCIRTRCGRLENALLHMTVYAAHANRRNVDNSCSSETSHKLTLLATARNAFRRASAPLLEKAVLAEAALVCNDAGNCEERDECAAAYREIDQKYSGIINWAVL